MKKIIFAISTYYKKIMGLMTNFPTCMQHTFIIYTPLFSQALHLPSLFLSTPNIPLPTFLSLDGI